VGTLTYVSVQLNHTVQSGLNPGQISHSVVRFAQPARPAITVGNPVKVFLVQWLISAG
jgi:hypothetical protein